MTQANKLLNYLFEIGCNQEKVFDVIKEAEMKFMWMIKERKKERKKEQQEHHQWGVNKRYIRTNQT